MPRFLNSDFPNPIIAWPTTDPVMSKRAAPEVGTLTNSYENKYLSDE